MTRRRGGRGSGLDPFSWAKLGRLTEGVHLAERMFFCYNSQD